MALSGPTLMIHIFIFLSVTLSVLLFGMAVFAFTAPLEFSKWFVPWQLMSRSLFAKVPEGWDRNFAYFLGAFSLSLLLGLSFGMGSFFVHVFVSGVEL